MASPTTIKERLRNTIIPTRAAVVGAGSWGTGIAFALGEAGVRTTLWARDPEVARTINEEHRNKRYLATCRLSKNVRAASDWSALSKADLIFFVVPSSAFRSIAKKARESGQIKPGARLITATKGIEKETGMRMSEVLGEELPGHPILVLSGPNHAEEVGQRQPTAAVIGCADLEVAAEVQEVFRLPWLRAYTSDDLPGIEWGGAVKNVFAIAAGISDGLGLGDNAKAALVTRGLAEMVRIGSALGGTPETFGGLSGVGDLIATCYSLHSRNYTLGREIGTGRSLDDVVSTMTMVAEGVPNTESIYLAARQADARTPIIDLMYGILYKGKSPADALSELFSRAQRPELDNLAEEA